MPYQYQFHKFEASTIKSIELKILRFPVDRHNYSFETQILATVLFNYALLGLISYLTLLFIHTYAYVWPFWFMLIFVSLALMEMSLRVKDISLIKNSILILSIYIFSPLGLYLSGSITTPSSAYLLLVLINICILGTGRKRTIYFFSLLMIAVSFMIIEDKFPFLLILSPPSKAINMKLWNFIYIGIVWIVFREVTSVTNVLAIHRKNLANHNQVLYHESLNDGLTGVFNKKHLLQTLDVQLLGLRRKNSSLGILLLDIDNFKAYNDHYGHMEGDKCLKEVARLLNECLMREGDKTFRFGGEEFVIVLDSIDLDGAIVVAIKILNSLRDRNIPHELSSTENYVTVSIGIAVFNRLHVNLSREDLLKYPDKAMYEAKKSGKNQYKVINTNQDDKIC